MGFQTIPKKKAVLASLPWQPIESPSHAIALLAKHCENAGIHCDQANVAVHICEYIPLDTLKLIAARNPLNELLHASLLFEKQYRANRKAFIRIFGGRNASRYYGRYVINIDLFEELMRRLKRYYKDMLEMQEWGAYDVIGFTTSLNQFHSSLYFSQLLKKRFPQVKTLLGGAYCTRYTSRNILNRFKYIDFCISEAGEQGLVELIQQLSCRQPKLFEVPSLAYREASGSVQNEIGPDVINEDARYIPTFDDYYERVRHIEGFPIDDIVLPIEAGRGCPYKCSFCNLNVAHPHYQNHSINYIVRLIRRYNKLYGCYTFALICHLFYPKAVDAELSNEFFLITELRADTRHHDLLKLKKMGVRKVQIGIENFSKKMLGVMNKHTSPLQGISVLKDAIYLGIKAEYNIIVEHPGETARDLSSNIQVTKLITHLPPPNAVVPFEVKYGSPVSLNPKHFKIKRISPLKPFQILYGDLSFENPVLLDFEHESALPLHKAMQDKFRDVVNQWEERYSSDNRDVCRLILHNDEAFIEDARVFCKRKGRYKITDVERDILKAADLIVDDNTFWRALANYPKKVVEKSMRTLMRRGLMLRDDKFLVSVTMML